MACGRGPGHPLAGLLRRPIQSHRRAAGDRCRPSRPSVSAATGAVEGPQVVSSGAAPASVDLGEAVALTWEARGSRAVMCPSARFVLSTPEDCHVVALTGAMAFTIPAQVGFHFIDFLLWLEGSGCLRARDATGVRGPEVSSCVVLHRRTSGQHVPAAAYPFVCCGPNL
jgi:hypothetical protein